MFLDKEADGRTASPLPFIVQLGLYASPVSQLQRRPRTSLPRWEWSLGFDGACSDGSQF